MINISSDRLHEAVNRGVQAARAWCVEQGIPLDSADGLKPEDPTKLRFTEEMKAT